MLSLLSHLAIVSNDPMRMIVQIALPYLTFNSSRYIPGLELLDHMLILVSNIFKESLYCFPQCLYNLYNFTFSSAKYEWWFFPILVSFWYCHLFTVAILLDVLCYLLNIYRFPNFSTYLDSSEFLPFSQN